MLKNIIVLFLFLVSNAVFAYSDEDLNEIEYIKYGTVFENESLSSRLKRLEMDCFGLSQSGDLDLRIKNLSKIITAGNYRNIQPYNAYDFPKKNLLQKVWDNFSGYMSMPYVTGFSPPIFDDNSIYSNDLYNREYMKMKNNYYCPSGNAYDRNYHQGFRNHNKYWNGRNNLNSYNPYPNINPYRHNPIYNTYFPTNSYTNVSTGSTVRILRD